MQFNVRAAVIGVAAVAVVLGWEVNGARKLATAVAAVKEYGGFVHYDYDYVNGTYVPGRQPWAPQWLRRAIGDDFFRRVVEINLVFDGEGSRQVQTQRTDDGVMPALGDLTGARTLFLHEGQATDRSMEVVGRLRLLEKLYISEAEGLTDVGLAHLPSLRNLTDLSLTQARITDAGLSHLSGLHKLKKLYVWPTTEDDGPGPCITDAGLRHLSGLTELEELTIFNGSFTDRGLAAVAPLVNLRACRLTFGSYQFTPAGLALLKPLRNLKELDLQGDGVPGQGLHYLGDLPNLTRLLLGLQSPLLEHGSDLSVGVERLARSRPDMMIQ